MSDTPQGGGGEIVPPFKNVEAAPFIYFDFVPSYGTAAGAVQIELAARTLQPSRDNSQVIIELTCTGHIRCSPAAALSLRDAIDATLKMLEKPHTEPSAAAGKLN